MKNRTTRKPILVLTLVLAYIQMGNAQSDERVRRESELLREGYVEYVGIPAKVETSYQSRLLTETDPFPFEPHSLPWPVAFADNAHTIGNSMAQFQPFSSPPYFHGGVDIRTETKFEVTTPVSGWLEAGHYSYTTQPNGSMKKFFKPWPQTGSPVYFEVAVTTSEGIRFEFHHMDRDRLPANIVSKLNQGHTWVEAKTVLGHAVYFSSDYNHIHYNVILPDETRINPEFVAPLIADKTPPKILGSYAIMANQNTVTLDQPLRGLPKEFIVATIDQFDLGPYEHPPVFAQVLFENGAQSTWDFTQKLLGPDLNFPTLSSFYKDRLKTPDGEWLTTQGGYGDGTSLIRLPVPATAKGSFTIKLSDIAGNTSEIKGAVKVE